MGWTQTLKEEWPNTLLQVSLSALGFLIALAINSGLANLNERASYNSMLTSIRAEADLNETILTNSFEKYYENGLVLRQFVLLSTSQCLANPIFVQHATRSDLKALNAYLLNLSLANGYQRISEQLYLTDSQDRELRERIKEQWKNALRTSGEAIMAVKSLAD